MDSGLLVATKIEDGQRLINLLIRDQFDVRVAFWVKMSEYGRWQLWIASAAVDPKNKGDALQKVYEVLGKLPGGGITPMDLTLIEATNPIARAAIELRDRYSSREPIPYRGERLANLATEELLIYPRVFPWSVREGSEGRWEVLISERDDVWLTCDSEDDARAISAAPVLQYEALERLKSGELFAAELEKTADAMEKYRMGFGSRFLRRRAEEARHR
jgi:hypothetical protein